MLSNYLSLAVIASFPGLHLAVSCFKPAEGVRHFFAAEVDTWLGLDASWAATAGGTGAGREGIIVGPDWESSWWVVGVLEEGACWDLLFLYRLLL